MSLNHEPIEGEGTTDVQLEIDILVQRIDGHRNNAHSQGLESFYEPQEVRAMFDSGRLESALAELDDATEPIRTV